MWDWYLLTNLIVVKKLTPKERRERVKRCVLAYGYIGSCVVILVDFKPQLLLPRRKDG
jgi:hypothetical protein